MNPSTIWTVCARDVNLITPTPTADSYQPRENPQTLTKICVRCDTQSPHLMGHTVCIYCEMDDAAIAASQSHHSG